MSTSYDTGTSGANASGASTTPEQNTPTPALARFNERVAASRNARQKIGVPNPLVGAVPQWNQTMFDASVPSNMWHFESAQCWIPLTRHLGATDEDVTFLSDVVVTVRQHVREIEPYIHIKRYLGDVTVEGSNCALTLAEARELIDILQAAVEVASEENGDDQ